MHLHGTRTPKSDSIPSDETLVKEYLAGDREAFATLYGRYFDRVTGYVVNRTRSRQEYVADREDLVQEIFAEALRLLPTFRASDYDTADAFRRWLYHVPAGNVLFQYFRRYWCNRQAYARSVDTFASHLREEARQATTTAAPAIELPQEIRDAFDALTADQRRAIELHYREGLTIRQTARVMRLTYNQANGLIHRARCVLRNPNPDPTTPGAARPRSSDANASVRLALLTAACELLTEKGTCTGTEAAARVGRNPTIVFHYFDSVGDLIAQASHLLNPTSDAPTPIAARKKRANGQVRLDLLAAARELLAEKGTFTTAEVATRADMHISLISRYFGGIANLRAEAAGQSAVAA